MQRLVVFALGLMLALALPAAGDDAGPGYVTNPVWVTVPPEAQVASDLPRSGYAEFVPLFCAVHEGSLTSCRAVDASVTQEYMQAATQAASAARIAPQDGDGSPTEGREVFLFVDFPDRPDAPASATAPPVSRSVMWTQRPAAAGLDYPPAARARGVSGAVVLDCLVEPTGAITCTVLSERPEGYGFGALATRYSKGFHLVARALDGSQTAGGRVRVPMQFSPP